MAMTNRQYRDLVKVIRVINSCKTVDQLSVAENVAHRYDIKYQEDESPFEVHIALRMAWARLAHRPPAAPQ